ncbi:hypothetical protein QYM36_019303 [Artemia franciscana]|uniref:PiggyBac transposable element-derived protein domain-containing protein n=1 Tax=Artemia franciscana TaxID=6661 RepID=A0AA88H836_ARTSF|nr:hypothetical protein QYM36_019303 [Artemia franciscana]
MGDKFEEALKKSRNLRARRNFEPEQALKIFMELQDGDVSEMLDVSDNGDDESDSQYLPLNPELTNFYDLTLLGPIVDEQIIPFKRKSVMCLYLQNKLHKWEFKVFTRAGSSGSMYNIEIYQGRGTVDAGPFGLGGDEIEYDWVGTIHQNRLSGCELMGEKEMKRFRMGNVDWRVDKSTEICLVRWYDNKEVTLVSKYVAVEPKDTCRRWDSSEKKYVEIERQVVIKEYNKHMGGVD